MSKKGKDIGDIRAAGLDYETPENLLHMAELREIEIPKTKTKNPTYIAREIIKYENGRID